MGKSDVFSLSTVDLQRVLDSIQNEYYQLQKEENSLSKLNEELSDLISQRDALSKREYLNEKHCIVCCLAFNLLFKRKLFCRSCHHWVCRSCATWDHSSKDWICHVCEKQQLLDRVTTEWICNRVKSSFNHFSAAKALQNYCRQKKISDNDSGYGTVGDFPPLMKFLSIQSLNRDWKVTDLSPQDSDCEGEEEACDEEELLEIQDSIETILEGLLGGMLDDALIGQLYSSSPLYKNLFTTYHTKLVEVIENLSRALQKALHNLPIENGMTPTTAHAALKNVITALVNECQTIPPFQYIPEEDSDVCPSSPFSFASIISSYESLVAAAVINKVVEESQSKYKIYSFSDQNLTSEPEVEKYSLTFHSSIGENEEIFNHMLDSTSFDLPLKCVKIEEVEEIMQEFTDSEDDKLSSISKHSNTLLGADVQIQPDFFIDLDHSADSPTPFPEFGCNLVDGEVPENSSAPYHLAAVTSWQENWLFKKKKCLPLYSNLKFHLLTYCNEPPSMLIPCPTEFDDLVDQDGLSELSEAHSEGTLDFSSDSETFEDNELESQPKDFVAPNLCVHTFLKSSPFPSLSESNLNNISQSFSDKDCSTLDLQEEVQLKQKLQEQKPELRMDHKELDSFSCKQNINELCFSSEEVNEKPLAENLPRPGTIAEREHQKWLNAVPLKHNPYSAENISKRRHYKNGGGLQEAAASFEEFERTLASNSSEPLVNRVNCGPKSIDSALYKRDYYINKDIEKSEDLYSLQRSLKLTDFGNDDLLPLSEEALNSFEEKVYVRSGQVFTLENNVKRLEQEIKDDMSLSSEMSKNFDPSNKETLPSDSNLMSNKQELGKSKKNNPCRKVHSLTARSLSREFRDLAKQNLPKPRTIPVPTFIYDETERECLNLLSPESAQSSLGVAHGYTSDESNTSSNSASRPKPRRHISRSILERASYWERRAEQGLLSDVSVNEEFPAVEVDND